MSDNIELRSLNYDDAFGYDELEVLQKYGRKTAMTDLAILTGTFYDNPNHHVPDDSSLNGLRGRTGLVCVKLENNYKANLISTYGWYVQHDSNARYGMIRPVLTLPNTFLEVTRNKQIDYNEVEEVAYGEYPQYVAPKSIQGKLDKEFNLDHLVTTGKTYTFIAIERHENSTKAKPIVYKEYEYKGKKYIRIQAKTFNDEKVKLSNGFTYKTGDYVWVEVSPVVWLVDNKTRQLVSKRGLVSGLMFFYDNTITYNGKRLNLNSNFTEFDWYIKEYMSKEIVQTINPKLQKAYAIVEEIKELCSLSYGYTDAMYRVHNLIMNYNIDIKRASNNGHNLTLDDMNIESLYKKLIDDLENILSEAKKSSEKYKEYTKMLDFTRKCIEILDGSDYRDVTDDFIKDIITIKKVILPFLNNNNNSVEIKQIFLTAEKDIISYLKGNDNSLIKEYHNLEEYKLGLRKKIQPFLITLNNEARNKDILEEIQNGYTELSKGFYKKHKDGYINYLLDDIREFALEININGTDADKEKLAMILADKPNFNQDLESSLMMIINLYISVYKIYLNIQERAKMVMEVNNYTIDVEKIGLKK